jgi:tyrosine-protein phosphatase SIW14
VFIRLAIFPRNRDYPRRGDGPPRYGAVTEKIVAEAVMDEKGEAGPETLHAKPPVLGRPVGGRLARWVMGLVIAALVVGVPIVYYRYSYTHSKRLREVEAGKLYRSGAMTVAGFREAIERYGIRTVINLQDEAPDPNVPRGFFDRSTERESELCRELNVNYRFINADLVHPQDFPAKRPAAIDEFLRIMDDPANYPVLIHCRAGLHRTGCLVALYRVEYDGWTAAEAIREMKDLGFGEFACSNANLYIVQYITAYQRGLRVQSEKFKAKSSKE